MGNKSDASPRSSTDPSKIAPSICPTQLHSCLSAYQILGPIGSGAQSNVLMARCKSCSLLIALKSLKKSNLAAANQVQHVFNEKQILQLMNSRFVEAPIAWFQDEESLYLVLEYLSGGDLFTLMCQQNKFSVIQTVFYAAELSTGLMHLHAINCVYRDLKPENILLTAAGHVKIGDLGLSKVITHGEKTFTFCGTPEYMSPEMVQKSGHTCSSDWWQFGVLIFEMQVGHPPFSGDSPFIIYNKILNTEVEYTEDMDPMTVSLLRGLLQKRPEWRLQGKDVRTHSFFQSVDWTLVEAGKMQPPFLPHPENTLPDSEYLTKAEETDVSMGAKAVRDSAFDKW